MHFDDSADDLTAIREAATPELADKPDKTADNGEVRVPRIELCLACPAQ
jgi:hypothetical protein